MSAIRIVFIALLGGLAVAAQALDDSTAKYAATGTLVLVFVGAVAGPLMELAEKATRERKAAREEKIGQFLDRWPVTARDLALEEFGIEVSPMARRYAAPGEPPPYISRDAEGALFHALQGNRVVLMIGPSGAGKSRM